MWKNTVINIGNVLPKHTYPVKFEFTGECEPKDVTIRTSCGCTNARWDKEKRVLSVTYRSGNIPRHLNVDTHAVSKSVKMQYICNDEKKNDTLTFKAVIIK